MVSDVGTTLGCLLGAVVGDLFGRRRVYLASTWCCVLMTSLQALSPTLWFYSSIGMISGIAQQVNISFILHIYVPCDSVVIIFEDDCMF